MNEDALHPIDDYKECQRLRRVIRERAVELKEEQKLHKETVRQSMRIIEDHKRLKEELKHLKDEIEETTNECCIAITDAREAKEKADDLAAQITSWQNTEAYLNSEIRGKIEENNALTVLLKLKL
jgi:chromosome segregation ATPase